MPGKRATSRVERSIMLLTALKLDRMGAVVRSEISQSDHFLRIIPPTKRQKSFALSARVPSFERDRPPGGPPLVTPQLNGGPARRAVNDSYLDTSSSRAAYFASALLTSVRWLRLKITLKNHFDRSASSASSTFFFSVFLEHLLCSIDTTRFSATTFLFCFF